MGQRTQLVLVTKRSDGTQRTRTYHYQWGSGRPMAMELIGLLNETLFYRGKNGTGAIDEIAPKHGDPRHNSLVIDTDTEQWKKDEGTGEYPPIKGTLETLNVEDIEQVATVFNWHDNNNGGVVVEVSEFGWRGADIRYGFVLGYEESDEPFTQYVTLREYVEKCCQTNNFEDFIDACEKLLKTFDVQQFSKIN